MSISPPPPRRRGRPPSRPDLEPQILRLLTNPELTYDEIADHVGVKRALIRSVATRYARKEKPPVSCTDEGADTKAEAQCTTGDLTIPGSGEPESEAA